MLKILQGQINNLVKLLTGKKPIPDDELYLYVVLFIDVMFAGVIHILLFGVSCMYNMPVMIWANVGSMCVYAALLVLLVTRRAYKLTCIVMSFEVLAYTMLASLCAGTGNYILLYCFMVMFMQLMLPYASVKFRGIMVVLIWLSAMAAIVLVEHFGVIYASWQGQSNAMMSIFNVNLTFVSLVFELMSGNIIRGVIARNNGARMEEYKSQANTDMLTGLSNRRYAETLFKGLLEKHNYGSWCVAMLDIDDFKVINDTMGHPVGDEVLRGVADFLKDNLRKADVVIRWGGEEFLMLLADVELGAAHKLMEKVCVNLSNEDIKHSGGTARITVTIGVNVLDLQDVDGSIALCDKCMYLGKNKGKNRVVSVEE